MSEATIRAGVAAGGEGAAWVMPEVRGPVISFRGRSPSASGLDAETRAAWEAGFERGRVEGAASVARESAARLQQLDERAALLQSLIDSIARPLDRFDEQAAAELARLAVLTGAQLARRDLRLDPSQVIAIIRDCVQMLPASAREVRVHLHPQDAAVVRERLAATAAERAWTVIEDPVLGRGGCRVVTDVSQIDARLESRIASTIVSILGDERGAGRANGGEHAVTA
jgi:flagellar assembly protein FliH